MLSDEAAPEAAAEEPGILVDHVDDEKSDHDAKLGAAPEASDWDDDFVVSFEDISVRVPESGWKYCTCKDSPIKNFGQEYLGMSVEERGSFYSLDRVSGYVRAGETCLVLGPSGSGEPEPSHFEVTPVAFDDVVPNKLPSRAPQPLFTPPPPAGVHTNCGYQASLRFYVPCVVA